MTTWHWVRHGPTHEKNFVGWRDVPADLSDTARIARLSAFLPEKALVVSSDLIRSITTADALEMPGHRRLPHRHDLRELHFGDWDGKHFSEVSDMHPDLSRAYWETPGDVAPPGGESWNAAAERVRQAVDELNARPKKNGSTQQDKCHLENNVASSHTSTRCRRSSINDNNFLFPGVFFLCFYCHSNNRVHKFHGPLIGRGAIDNSCTVWRSRKCPRTEQGD